MHQVLINAIVINYDWLIISTFRDKTIPRNKMNQLLCLKKEKQNKSYNGTVHFI